jgi:hypothetical protein
MKNLNSLIITILLITIYGCGSSEKAEWAKREELKSLEKTLVKSIKLLESKEYEKCVKLLNKPSFISQLSSPELDRIVKGVEKNNLALIEAYKKLLKTEPRIMDYDPGKKPANVDETVIFIVDNNFVAFDRIGYKWYQQ